jgi:hypothetical protein
VIFAEFDDLRTDSQARQLQPTGPSATISIELW